MNDRQIREAAATLYGSQQFNFRPYVGYDSSRSQHSINFITEDFLAGFMQDGRMSVVRRFFCLFVTFDLVFISLLWIICAVITGDNIYDALRAQVLHYSIYSSLFDIVMAAIVRFVVLVLFYGLLYINHWSIIALCTTGSCGFLITKVFYYNWLHSPQPVFEVLLILISFILSWGEAWFLDCRVIPQERHARNYFVAATTPGYMDDRTPLLAPFLNAASIGGNRTESVGNFYSPYDSIHNSDDEDEQEDEYKRMGIQSVRQAHLLLESKDWKIEKVTAAGDSIQSTHRDKLGKIYRLTARVNCAAKELLEDLFYKIEEVPKWNPTLLESRIIRKLDPHTDITYQATIGGGGGVVKSRDFVNLRCWQLIRDGRIVEDYILNPPISTSSKPDTDTPSTTVVKGLKKSMSDDKLHTPTKPSFVNQAALSKSLGAKQFFEPGQSSSEEDVDAPNGDEQDDAFLDAENTESVSKNPDLFISSAISIQYPNAPAQSSKYIRGENLISCWAMREIPAQTDWCIFEWIICLDLKGYIPRYVLDTAYTSLMQEYMTYLRSYVNTINKKSKSKSASTTK